MMYEIKYHDKDLSHLSFLVTGGAGFIGSNIVEYLMKHNAKRIVVLDDLSTGFEENLEPFMGASNFEFIKGDITQLEDCKRAVQGIDYVTHQAALGSVPRSVENPIATHQVNASGFLNMLVAARDAGVKKFVYASSSSVYGDSKELPKVEEKIGKPLSPYAVTKYLNELYADVFGKTYGMKIIGLRYFNIFGPRQNPKGAYAAAIPLFMDALIHNTSPFINGDGNQSRDFTFVENAVQANVKAMLTENEAAVGHTYNIACGDRVTVNDLFNVLKTETGASIEAVHRAERAGDIRDSLANISKAQNLLDYQPAFMFDQGLKITLDWFKKRFY
jgi:UDP-N-acetylglucosamine 4-epimerase